MSNRVLLAFSGGIDSSAAVGILRREGFDVEVMTIDMMGDEALVVKAASAAERLGVKFHLVDGRELFSREIVDDFVEEYLSGRTPAPCTRCNTLIKWRLLVECADRLGIHYIATGHYFRVEEHRGLAYVRRGNDPKKDQSYYLWGVPQEALSRAVTPMGELIKAEVKLGSDEQRESMGVCFLGGRPYSEFLCSRCGELAVGEVVNTSGEVVGRHNGIARYTIGQRRGEGIPSGLRVVGLDGERNVVTVGDNRLLFHTRLIVDSCYFVDPEEVVSSTEVSVMIRGIGLNPEGYASVKVIESTSSDGVTAEITLSNPAWAAAAGQPVVLYIGDRVVGGGYLKSSFEV